LHREIRSDDETFDVLVLAGSTLHDRYGPFEAALREELALRSRREVRVHNLAKAAQGTRDSLIKYQQLDDARFDLVIVYHGINDLRANNIAEADYRDGYEHVEWYRRANWVAAHRDLLRWTALPYLLHDARIAVEKLLGRYRPLPPDSLRNAADYGETLKTVPAFRDNLAAILELARKRGEPVLLMTYAWHLPPDYSKQAFRRRESDYTTHRVPVEGWGRPEHVARGLRAHNEAIRELVAAHPDVLFVDQDARMPRDRASWNDICHLSVRGMSEFAAGVAEVLAEAGILAESEATAGNVSTAGAPAAACSGAG
jgi:lysophospholipase L1-like esterase